MSFHRLVVSVEQAVVRRKALEAFKALSWFAIVRSSDPEKQKLLDRLHELRIQIQDIMDVLAPGWEK